LRVSVLSLGAWGTYGVKSDQDVSFSLFLILIKTNDSPPN